MRRRFTALVAALCVTALAVTAAGAQQPTGVTVGTAETTVDLLNVTLEGLPVDLDAISLGQVRSFASIDDDPALNVLGGGVPFALSSITLPGGQEIVARSDGDTGKDGESAALPGGVGAVTAGSMSAVADAVSARSLINALSGNLTAGLAGISAAVPSSGVKSVVDSASSTASNGAVLSGLSLGISDLVPLDILEQLPLDTLLSLVDELNLPIDLPANLDVLRDQLDQLVAQIQAITGVAGDIEGVQTQLDDVVAQLEEAVAAVDTLEQSVADLQAALAAAEGEVAAVQAELDAALADADAAELELAEAQAALDALLAIVGTTCDTAVPLPGCEDLAAAEQDVADASSALSAANDVVQGLTATLEQAEAAADDLQAQLDAALADLADAQALVDTLTGTIEDLQATLDALIGQLQDLLDDLLALVESIDIDDLTALVDELVAGLAAGEILGVDQIVVGVQSIAGPDGSEATALCSVDGVAVLGQLQAVDTCAELQATLSSVTAAIEGLLSNLPIVGGALPADLVTVRGLTTATTPNDARQGDYFVAESAVRALELGVEPIALTQVTGGLVAEIQGVIDGVLGQLDSLGVELVDASALEAALADLQAQLEQLPTGDLAGVSTPRLGVTGLETAARSNYNAAGTNPTPVPGSVPGQPAVGSPTGTGSVPGATPASGTLPRTGAGIGLAAIMLLGIGAGAIYWVRSRQVS